MKILFITQHFLDKNGGGSFASRAYINAFADIASEMTLLYPDNGNSINEFINPKVELVRVQNKSSDIAKLVDIYKGRLHRYTEIFPAILQKFDPELVVFDNSRTSAGLIKKLSYRNIKAITIHHNFELEYYRGSPPKWYYKKAFMYYMKQTEKEATEYSTINFTLTYEDILLLQKEYDKNKKLSFERLGCFEYQNNIHKNQIHKPKSKVDKLTFVITGNLSTYQTEKSLTEFLNQYYPILLNLFNKSNLIVAGRNPSENIVELCKRLDNVKLIPNPVDMNEIIAMGDIYICPTNIGGGLKLRIMDGLKMGLPVITHKVSSRGYESLNDTGCLFIYDNPTSFSKELKNAVETFVKGEISATDIQNKYYEYFSYTHGVERLVKILDQYHLTPTFKEN